MSLKNKSVECIIECSAIELTEEKVIIICIYRPGSGNTEDLFFSILTDILEEASEKKKHKILVCGDFNLNLLKSEETNTKKFLDVLDAFNLKPLITTPTRITPTTSSLLDNIMCNDHDAKAEILLTALSDHTGQIAHLSKHKQKPLGTKKIRPLTTYNMQYIYEHLSSIEWVQLLEELDVEESYNSFYNQIMVCLNLYATEKVVHVKDFYNTMWLTEDLKNRCKTKRLLYEDTINGRLNKEEYKKYVSNLQKDIDNAKRNANSQHILEAQNKTKATWQIVQGITDFKNNKKFEVKEFEHLNSNTHDIMNMFNNYLLNIRSLNTSGDDHLKNINLNAVNSFYIFPTDEEEVIKTIHSLKNTGSTGEDQISTKLLKYIAEVIAEPLTIVTNKIFLRGIYPSKLKEALIIPLHKKGSRTDFGNYRPIALISTISKVIEKLLLARINKFLERNNIINTNQNGYIKGRSTIRAIYSIVQEILTGLSCGETVLGAFIDLSKAFDRINHTILRDKLEKIGFRGIPLQLIQNYLNNRRQRILATDERTGTVFKSDWKCIDGGVPQGSILGPLLFLLYVNDLPDIIEQQMSLFADDTSIVVRTPTATETKTKLIECLEKVEEWFKANALVMNSDKTQMMRFSLQEREETMLCYNNTMLVSSAKCQFLGVTLDSQLNWKSQIDNLAKKIAAFSYALKVISREVTVTASLEAYYAYVDSRLRYGIIFWGNSTELQRLFILQKKCIRRIYGLKRRDSCRPVFKESGILTLSALFVYELVKFVSINFSFFASYVQDHSYNTRWVHNNNLILPQTTSTRVRNAVESCCIRAWNKIPMEARQLPTAALLKRLKSHLQNLTPYQLEDFFEAPISI